MFGSDTLCAMVENIYFAFPVHWPIPHTPRLYLPRIKLRDQSGEELMVNGEISSKQTVQSIPCKPCEQTHNNSNNFNNFLLWKDSAIKLNKGLNFELNYKVRIIFHPDYYKHSGV